MPEYAIVSEGLSKNYRLTVAGRRHRHDSLSEQLTEQFRSLFRRNGDRTIDDIFWALKDVSFDVRRGEVVGVIGSNGAGKSTLLKILARITTPTAGVAAIHGRVASLLEVGTGFQPELSGRENIFLSGAILGMRKKEIKRNFDEIVEFAGISRFIDTPVKRYSSGMYVRLAFAVAAHLEADIMLVDEVLAVGDADFQRKCLGKMKDVVTDGRTVLFVSHNMPAVLNLCERSFLLEGGQIVSAGETQHVVGAYLQGVRRRSTSALEQRVDRKGSQRLKFVGVELRNSSGSAAPHVQSGEGATIALAYRSGTGGELDDVFVSIGVHGKFDENLFDLSTVLQGFTFERIPESGTFICHIPRLPLQPGTYPFNVYCEVAGDLADWVQNAGHIEVEPGDFYGSGKLSHPDQGPFLVDHSWDIAPDDQNVRLSPHAGDFIPIEVL